MGCSVTGSQAVWETGTPHPWKGGRRRRKRLLPAVGWSAFRVCCRMGGNYQRPAEALRLICRATRPAGELLSPPGSGIAPLVRRGVPLGLSGPHPVPLRRPDLLLYPGWFPPVIRLLVIALSRWGPRPPAHECDTCATPRRWSWRRRSPFPGGRFTMAAVMGWIPCCAGNWPPSARRAQAAIAVLGETRVGVIVRSSPALAASSPRWGR